MNFSTEEIAFAVVMTTLLTFAVILLVVIAKRIKGHRYREIGDCANRLNYLECDEHREMQVVMSVEEHKIDNIVTEKIYFSCPHCGKEWYKLKRDLNPNERSALFRFNHNNKNKTTEN